MLPGNGKGSNNWYSTRKFRFVLETMSPSETGFLNMPNQRSVSRTSHLSGETPLEKPMIRQGGVCNYSKSRGSSPLSQGAEIKGAAGTQATTLIVLKRSKCDLGLISNGRQQFSGRNHSLPKDQIGCENYLRVRFISSLSRWVMAGNTLPRMGGQR